MHITKHDTYIKIHGESTFSAQQSFTCGQCFRWNEQPDGTWLGIAGSQAARVWDEDGDLCITCTREQFDAHWFQYFDCGTNYAAVCRSFGVDDFTKKAAAFGAGIRILKQDPWEMLCTFILSQRNNIPRIAAIVERLCEGWGTAFTFEGKTVYTFPTAEVMASLTEEDLEPLRAGYRTPYLLGAAKAVVSGEIVLRDLISMPTKDARKEVMKLHGVGEKVADCFLLFGLHKLDAFPVDTWMKKAEAFYEGDMKPFKTSRFAGIYQQYFFYYMRENQLG